MNDLQKRRDFELSVARTFNVLRNEFSLSESFQYITALVFLKWLESFSPILTRERKIHVDPNKSYTTLLRYLNEDFLGQKVNEIFNSLEKSNPFELKDIFNALDFTNTRFSKRKGRWELLRELLLTIDNSDLHRSDFDGFSPSTLDAYFTIVYSTVLDGINAPEFNTPREISELVANIACVEKGDSVYDPACGSGGLLLACAKYLSCDENIYGNEKNFHAWWIAKINIISHGISSIHIRNIDSLDPKSQSNISQEKSVYNVVVAHPPWGARFNNESVEFSNNPDYKFGIPPKSSADFAFIQHMLSRLSTNNGRMVAVMSMGTLTRGGQEKVIRERLINANLIDAVIALPEKLFQNTAIAGSLIVFKTRKESPHVFFYDARQSAKVTRGKSLLSNQSINIIAEAYHKREVISGFSNIVSIEEIKQNQYSFNINNYVESFTREHELDLPEIQARCRELEMELKEIDLQIKKLLRLLG